ncbi:hypothetical protein IWZ00DRAFT_544329 [Phyllosticta capitalensis]|uniref:Uncharacterized protein n=1 Tax=Phyllosticta capitalensis TaxID=121624 RepID=A0ABR1YNW0_9PEZI
MTTPKRGLWSLLFDKRVSLFDLFSQMALVIGSAAVLAPFYKNDDGGVADAVKLYQSERSRLDELLLKRRNAITKGNEGDVSLDWREREELDKIKQAQKKVYMSMMSLKASAKSLTDELTEEKAKVLGLRRPSDKNDQGERRWPGDA